MLRRTRGNSCRFGVGNDVCAPSAGLRVAETPPPTCTSRGGREGLRELRHLLSCCLRDGWIFHPEILSRFPCRWGKQGGGSQSAASAALCHGQPRHSPAPAAAQQRQGSWAGTPTHSPPSPAPNFGQNISCPEALECKNSPASRDAVHGPVCLGTSLGKAPGDVFVVSIPGTKPCGPLRLSLSDFSFISPSGAFPRSPNAAVPGFSLFL